MPSLWCHAERHFRDGSAALYYVSVEVHNLARVDDADPAGEDGHGVKGESVDMGGCIDAARHLRDENMSRSIELLYRPGFEINLEITQPTPPGHVREGIQRVLGILEGHQQTSKRDGSDFSRAI